jgi:hypothetical protein
MRYLRRNWPCVAILGLYALCILAANPKGEFPLNDDWSYTRSAFAFGSGHGLRVDEWTAPSLVGQAFYGGLLTRLFSPHFLVLRISTLFLSCCTLLLLWGILRRLGFRRDFASVMLLAWVFNPLQFSLSFTYMTEVPFVFFVALAWYLYLLHLEEGKFWPLALSAATLGYGYLVRQTALLFILALVCSLLLDSKKDISKRLREAMIVFCIAGIFIAGYYGWILAHGGATAAVHKKFELLGHLKFKQIIGNSYGMIFYLALMLAPVWVYLIPALWRMIRSFGRIVQFGVPAAWCALVVAGVCGFQYHYTPTEYLPATTYHSRMPFLINVLYDSGLGPITLEPDYFGASPTPIYPRVWYAVTAIVAVGVVLCGTLCVLSLIKLRRDSWKCGAVIPFAGLSFLFLALFEIVFSHVREGGLFDRHILILSFPLCLLLGIWGSSPFSTTAEESSSETRERPRSIAWIPAGISVAILALFCVAATHDYMEWNRIRWDMGRGLMEQGVDPLAIVGGFEFNAWNNYDTFAARGGSTNVNWWWYDRRDYIISMIPQEGYGIQQIRAYFSWVHRRPVNLYVLRLIPDSKFRIPN